jgi:hypothetical protein
VGLDSLYSMVIIATKFFTVSLCRESRSITSSQEFFPFFPFNYMYVAVNTRISIQTSATTLLNFVKLSMKKHFTYVVTGKSISDKNKILCTIFYDFSCFD